jgi:hypothetical protein
MLLSCQKVKKIIGLLLLKKLGKESRDKKASQLVFVFKAFLSLWI